MITPGNGVFQVNKNFARMTKKRMMDGIGCDVICLKRAPLHATPVKLNFSHQNF